MHWREIEQDKGLALSQGQSHITEAGCDTKFISQAAPCKVMHVVGLSWSPMSMHIHVDC